MSSGGTPMDDRHGFDMPKGPVLRPKQSGERFVVGSKPLTPEQQALADAVKDGMERSIVTAELPPHQAQTFRASRFNATGAVIIQGAGAAGSGMDLDAISLRDAENVSYTFTAGTGTTDQVIVSQNVEASQCAFVEKIAWRPESYLGYELVQVSLWVNGVRQRALNLATRPFSCDDTIPVNLLVLGAGVSVIQLRGTNLSNESAHLVYGEIIGYTFPVQVYADSLRGVLAKKGP